MAINLLGALTIMKELNVKPNFSELEREYGVNRHTIKKYFDSGGKKRKERKPASSKYDAYEEEIRTSLQRKGVTKIAVFYFLKDKYPSFEGTYGGFKDFVHRKGLNLRNDIEVHPRFETEIGSQLQVDWKESITLHTTSKEELSFNIFNATLGYSRFHAFIYSETKTTEDFLRCIVDAFHGFGGVPKHILTDNMAAIVSITNGEKHKHQKIVAFEKDIGVKIRLCRVRTPETKGKVESSNRFISRLLAYDYQLKDKEDLLRVIKLIERESNEEINQTTSLPPVVLFEKEKEYLLPIPNALLLESYLDNSFISVVPATLLVSYQGKGYSVPLKYINKRVKVFPVDNRLYIYQNSELIATHDISWQKINYQQSHLEEAYKTKYKDDSSISITRMAEETLNRFAFMK